MKERVNQVPRHQFVTTWNSASTLAEATARIAGLAGRTVPGWAVLSRASELRKQGFELQRLLPPPPRTSVPTAETTPTN